MEDFKNILQILEYVFPEIAEGKYSLEKQDTCDLLFWAQPLVEVYHLNISESIIIPLINPKKDIHFDLLLIVHKQISFKVGSIPPLVIADLLPSKFRPLLVKFRIPFIYKNKTIFAPQLFMATNELEKYSKIEPKSELITEKPLSPFAIKLISTYLTKQIGSEIKLSPFLESLNARAVYISLAKLSLIFKELVENGFMRVIGKGPEKTFRFKEVNEVWELLISKPKSKLMKVMKISYAPKEKIYVFSGETALAKYTDLSEPNEVTIALSSYLFQQLEQKKIPIEKQEHFVLVQIWKEDPKLFSIDGKLNPIELFLTMQPIEDERIQIAFDQLLKQFDLTI